MYQGFHAGPGKLFPLASDEKLCRAKEKDLRLIFILLRYDIHHLSAAIYTYSSAKSQPQYLQRAHLARRRFRKQAAHSTS